MGYATRLSDAVSERDNNFNLLRFGAACAVILSHSFILTGNEPNSLPRILGFFAVNCFFIISGFLVCKSLIERQNPKQFIRARVLRIYPALFVSVGLCVFVIGPLFSTEALNDYFFNSKIYTFWIKNSLLIVGDVEYYLPGVFEQSFNDRKVNAPLWTVFYEVYLYLILLFVALVFSYQTTNGLRRFKWVILICSLLLLVMFVINIGYQITASSWLGHFIRFGAVFGIGASLYLFRERILLSPKILFSVVVLIGISSQDRLWFNGICYLLLGYILLYCAYIPKGIVLRFNLLGDYSYGLYIFAYPIQQIVLQWWPDIGTMLHFVISFLATLSIAMLSWHLVEQKALALK